MELTEEEKRIIASFNERLLEDPLSAIEEGLIDSYYNPEDYKEFKFAVYEYAKRILKEVAKKRNLEFDDNLGFGVEDIIRKEERVGDFDISYYEDYEKFKSYFEKKLETMDATEAERFYSEFFGGIGGINDSARSFMTKFIPRILENIRDLCTELEAPKEPDLDYREEDWIQSENVDNEWDLGDEWGDEDYSWLDEAFDASDEFFAPPRHKEPVTDEELLGFIKFLNTYPLISLCKENGLRISKEFFEVVKRKKLDEFFNDPSFMQDFSKIMEHDKLRHWYLFHGLQGIDSAETIFQEGLGMMKEDLGSTTYPEFDMEDLILYSRGFMGEVGKDAVLIIDVPKDENGILTPVVEPLSPEKKIHFSPSGLQGLDGKPHYIIDTKYIVGYVNKRDKKVVFNPRYYDYDRFVPKEKKEEDVER